MRTVEQVLKEVSKLSMVNEVSEPKVGTSLLNPTKACSRYKVRLYISLHDYLDEPYRWRMTVTIEETTENKARKRQADIENKARAIIKNLFDNNNKHDLVDDMEAWINSLSNRFEISTVDAYKDRFKLIKTYFEENPVNVEDFTAITMAQFCDWALDYGRVKPKRNKETGELEYGLSRRTVRDAHGLIYNFFQSFALKYRSVAPNPCLGTTVPYKSENGKHDKSEAAWMELDTYKKFKQWLQENTDKPKYKHLKMMIEVCEIGIQTGMRRQEICGLHWDKVSFENRTIRVAEKRIRTTSGVYDKKGVKSESSYRKYKMTDSMFQCLKAMQLRQQESGLYDPYGFVFIWEDPKKVSYREPYNPDHLTKTFKKAVVACPYTSNTLHIHSLRHSACSICYFLGWTMEEAANWLGHQSEDVTRDVYQHYKRMVPEDKLQMLSDAYTYDI